MTKHQPGDLFWGTRGLVASPLVVVGEAWGREEAQAAEPFVGAAGQLLMQMLREASVDPDSVLFTNIMNERPEGNDFSQFLLPGRGSVRGLNPKPELAQGLRRLYAQIAAHPRKLVIAAGNYPLWALTSVSGVNRGVDRPRMGQPATPDTPSGITSYHGSQLWLEPALVSVMVPKTPVLPIVHPAAILRDWPQRHTTVHDLRMRVPLAPSAWAEPQRVWFAPPTLQEAIAILDEWWTEAQLGQLTTLSLDIETKAGVLVTCIGLAHDQTAMSIPFVRINSDKTLTSYWTPRDEAWIMAALERLLHHPQVAVLGQNLNYDCQWLWHTMRLRPRVKFDTLIVQNLLFPGTPKDLGTLSAMWCSHHRYWKDDNREWSAQGTLEQHLRYNCEDVTRTLEIAQAQMEALVALDKAHLLSFEMERFELAREMNERGLRRAPQATMDAGIAIVEMMQRYASTLEHAVPAHMLPRAANGKPPAVPWYRSDSQTKWVLDLIGFPKQFNRKTGRPSSGKEAINALIEEFPAWRGFLQAILAYNSLDTIYTTFIKARLDADGRMRCSFGNTSTFRWTSSKNAFGRGGNLQNIPVGEGDEADADEAVFGAPALSPVPMEESAA